jgi:hypothetical protein
MEAAKERFLTIYKDLNVLITECENDNMEDDAFKSIIEARALASAGERVSAACIREDKRMYKLESGE